ncbi:MAG TPA: hypothetical protein PKD26_06090 [Pyrinomonadaceae bacterium]|nr:hypothetical protein [Pyrinomonadaceae bacterium]
MHKVAFGEKFAFSSSISANAWHPKKPNQAYEWWYFDALSDDGNEAVVIVFLDNFIYSPRYNVAINPDSEPAELRRFPAVSFTYFSGGRQIYRAVNEYPGHDFFASETEPKCIIGGSGFHFASAPYGSGFSVSVNLPLARGRQLEAEFEWLSIETDLFPVPDGADQSIHRWNMVAARSDVSGKMKVFNSSRRVIDVRTFRGTGYHDHNLDNRWLADTVREWHWGRAHFADLTAVFCSYEETSDAEASNQLLLIRDGSLRRVAAVISDREYSRDRFGIRYPSRTVLTGEGGEKLSSLTAEVIDSSFYHLRFLSTMTYCDPGERSQTTSGITEYIAPGALKYRWLNRLSDLRTGKNGKGPLI